MITGPLFPMQILGGEAMKIKPPYGIDALIEEERDDLEDWETVAELLEELDRLDRTGPMGIPPYLKRILAAYRREEK